MLFSDLLCLQVQLSYSCSCWSAICHGLIQEREKRLAAELRQAEGALTNGKTDRQALISQHAAALGQRVEALEKQLQKLQGVERASRQEVEKLSRQLYLKKPQVTLLVI